ncbi:MAG: hypothetical protein PVF82_16870 [Gammaproteobacteria bacterium]|jgi:uncharacterized Fe-S cluster-containing radical SAM superfamily protein
MPGTLAGSYSPDLQIILETNGILLGHEATYAANLAEFSNLYVRYSLKAASDDCFTSKYQKIHKTSTVIIL